MTRIVRLPLWGKVLLIAILNAALLAGASVWFLRTLLGEDAGVILLGSARERIVQVSRDLSIDLAKTEPADRDALLQRYAARYGQRFYLFLNSGEPVAGPQVTLPDEVLQRVQEGLRGPPTLRSPTRGRGMGTEAPQIPPFLLTAAPGYWVGVRMPVRTPGFPVVRLGTLLMASDKLFTNPFLFDVRPWLQLLGLALGATLLCWLPLTGGMTNSIQKLKRATGEIAAGAFRTKTDVRRGDELGQLGESINRMAGQLEEHVHGQKRFLRDAAHELRSPLARMQAAMGILERQTGPESDRLLGDLRDEIELMSKLTGDLLTLARSENSSGKVQLASVGLAEVAGRAVAVENAGRGADVRVEVDPLVRVMAHEESLFRGISNIVRNAIRYAAEQGPIVVSAAPRERPVVLTIADRGPGIPADAIDKVFTPFYRLDVSRDRKTGGTGLGMSIARACVETCQGMIECRNGDPGLEVRITLLRDEN